MVQHMMHHSKDIIQECISTVVWSFDEPNACNLIVIHVLKGYIYIKPSLALYKLCNQTTFWIHSGSDVLWRRYFT